MNKKVLILAYKFPPMVTIGTRRWAKFAKYLAEEGYKVFVLARRYEYNDTVNWKKDVENKNINITYFNTSYPMICLKNHKNIFEKVVCKIYNIIRNKLFYKIDIADAKSSDFFNKANEIIKKENITNLIVTAPPHVFSYYATLIKSEHPNINLIVDYRDPWNYFTPYTLQALNFKSKEKSLYMENQVIILANRIFCVTNDMTNNLKNLYPEYKSKISTLYNGFDVDDYKNIKKINKERDYIEILYAGALDKGRLEAIKLIAEVLNDYKGNLNIKFIFYSNINKSYFMNFKYKNIINRYFIFNNFLPKEQVLEKIKNTDICLSINSKDNIHAFGTKIFDYFALKKPIWHISNGGELYEILKKYDYLVSTYNKEEIKYICDKILFKTLPSFQNGLYNAFNLNNLVKKLVYEIK